MKDQRQLEYICKEKNISLKSLNPNEVGLSFEICFCGSFKCACMPIGVPNSLNTNQRFFFYSQIQDAFIEWEHSSNNSKSQLLIPAKGQYNKGKFYGSCQICKKYYKDYQQHINTATHVLRLRQNQYDEAIKLLCSALNKNHEQKISKDKKEQLKVNGKFANKQGRNKFSTRFTKKSRNKQIKLS